MFRLIALAVSILSLLVYAAGLAAGEGKDYSKKKFERDKKWDGMSLVKANFSDATLVGNSFRGAKLMGANFQDADLGAATFGDADCTGADFRHANLELASMQTTILSKANFEGLDLKTVSFYGAYLDGANLQKTMNWGDLNKADFRKADLRGASMSGARNASTAKWRDAIYDATTVWPQGFDHEAAGAKKGESLKKEKDTPNAQTVDQPKDQKTPADPIRPEGAPPVAVIKSHLEKFWGPPMQGGTKHTYDYKSIRFDAPVKRKFATTDGGAVVINTYPLTVVCEVTRTFTDGATRKETKNQSFYFYLEKADTWTYKFVQNN
jgi:hypothetical protein